MGNRRGEPVVVLELSEVLASSHSLLFKASFARCEKQQSQS